MKPQHILQRPVLTEKVNGQMETAGRYTFVVDKRANKLEIKKAVEEFYGVSVQEVNTNVVPAKAKSRNSKSGVLHGQKPSYKKATVTLKGGDSIDLFAN